ncbi:MAG: hypothetical protein ACOYD4_04020 [Solirubrobacterales bacterium]
MANCSKTQLFADACANGFVGRDEESFNALLLQLLCDISSGGGGGVATATGSTAVIANGTESGIVVFAPPLPASPAAVVLTVQSPVGGFILFANLVGAPSAAGFTFQLNGVTDSANYVLHYTVIP